MSRFPVLSRGQYRGLLLLEAILLLVMLVMFVRQSYSPRSSSNPQYVRRDSVRHVPARALTYAVPEDSVETFPFDPNTADSTTLLRLGLAPWQVRAIYKYRAKRGRYHEPADFQRLAGMTQELWDRLGPMVRIAPKYRLIKPQRRPSLQVEAATPEPVSPPAVTTDTAREFVKDPPHRSNKFRQLTQVDINAADTALLQRIPGIGSYRARMIVQYRQALGGYSHLEQVMESCELPDELLNWLSFSPVPLKQLDINRLSVRQLMRHPYISFYQAREIVEYRHEHGPFSGMDDLLKVPRLSQEDARRLQPYLLFQ